MNLFAAVKDGTIARGAQDVLVKRALAPLALRPETVEILLEVVDRGQRTSEVLRFVAETAFTERLGELFVGDRGAASDATGTNLGELHDAARLDRRRRLRDATRVLAV